MALRAATKASGTNDTLTITTPTVVNGDVVVLAVRDLVETVTWPSGFSTNATATADGTAARSGRTSVAWKVASSEPGSYNVSIGGGNNSTFSAVCATFSGRNSAGITSVSTNEAGAGTSPVSMPLTGYTAANGDDVCIIGCAESGNAAGTWVTTPASGYTLQQEQSLTGTFFGGTLSVSTKDAVSAGATGTLTQTATLSAQQADTYGIVIALPVSASANILEPWQQLGAMGVILAA